MKSILSVVTAPFDSYRLKCWNLDAQVRQFRVPRFDFSKPTSWTIHWPLSSNSDSRFTIPVYPCIYFVELNNQEDLYFNPGFTFVAPRWSFHWHRFPLRDLISMFEFLPVFRLTFCNFRHKNLGRFSPDDVHGDSLTKICEPSNCTKEIEAIIWCEGRRPWH